jgi:Fe-Mn family superoxide dismutase
MSGELSRRDLIASLGIGAVAWSAGALGAEAPGAGPKLPEPVPYELPPLPYAYDALAPTLDERIVRTHHDKHHAGYVKGLNAALATLAKARAAGDLADVRAVSRDLAFNGSGHILHTLYWQSLRPGAATQPEGVLRTALERDFGSVEKFMAQFAAAAKAVAGSGWAVLAYEPVGKRLLCLEAENHEKLTLWGVAPLMACDVWEHAYYLQYANDRGAYVDAVCKIIDWPGTAQRFAACLKEA